MDAIKAAVSVNFQSPSILVAISLLISLMEDQVARFSAIGIPSIATKGHDNWESMRRGEYQLIFMNPEALFDLRNQDMLRSEVHQEYLIGLAVVEAHCMYSLSSGATLQAKPSSRSFQLCYHCAKGKIYCVFLSLYC